LGIGTVIKLHFDGALTLTHHATDLILPGGVNITTAAGDEAEFVEYASGDWRCTSYFRAGGWQAPDIDDDAIITAKILDDNVTLPKLEGSIIPWVEIPATTENTSAVYFEGLDTTYDEFMLVISDATVGTDGSEFHVHLGYGATPTYLAASGYTEAGTGAGNIAGWWLSNDQGNDAGESCSGYMYLYKIHESAPTKCICRTAWQDTLGAIQGYDFVGLQSYSAGPITALRIDNTTGTQSTGDIKLYGRRK
jgi:hypothetical protein